MKFHYQDILNQSFSTKLMGYAPEQVDEFLESLAHEWRFLAQKLSDSESERKTLTDEVKSYRRRESDFYESVRIANQYAEDQRRLAKEEAQSIVAKAHQESETLLTQLEEEKTSLITQIQTLKSSFSDLQTALVRQVTAYLEQIQSATFDPALHESASKPLEDIEKLMSQTTSDAVPAAQPKKSDTRDLTTTSAGPETTVNDLETKKHSPPKTTPDTQAIDLS